jgi:type IV pilus assembly protein PilN
MQTNLLPWRAMTREKNKKEFLQLWLFSTLGMLIIVWLWHGLLSYQLSQQNSINETLNKKIISYASQDKIVAQLTQQKKELTTGLSVLQNQNLKNKYISQFLTRLPHLFPPGLLLVQLKWEANRITVIGKAKSAAQINELIHNLQTLPYLLSPVIQEEKAVSSQGPYENEFTLIIKTNA